MRALNSAAPATSALMLASGLATLIALGALVLGAWRDYADTLRGAEMLSAQVARLVEEHTQRYVSAPEQALRRLEERLAGVPVEAMGAEHVRLNAEGIARELPQLSSMFIADAQGQVLMISGFATFPPVNVSDRQYFRAHMQQGRMDTVVGPLIRSREPTPRYAFTVSRPLIRNGQTAGIVAATLDAAFFTKFYESLHLGDGALCSILTEDGWMVARDPILDTYLNRNLSHWSVFTERLAKEQSGTFVKAAEDDGAQRMFAYRRVAGLPLVIVAGLPLEGALAAWRARTLNNTGGVLALLALLQAALWLTWRGVTRERTLAAGLRRALDDNVTLFNEIHHRVKNNMQIVSSMLMIEQIRAGAGELSERLQLVADRVASMALVHTMLYERHEASRVDISAYLHELCRNLAEGHGTPERGIRIQVTADDTCLAMEQAVPLGLVVNEAVLNAIKHAFPDDRAGTIEVDFSGTETGGFALTVTDDGVGLAAQAKSKGIGTTIIRSLAGQLDACACLAARPGGRGTTVHIWRGIPQPMAPEPAET